MTERTYTSDYDWTFGPIKTWKIYIYEYKPIGQDDFTQTEPFIYKRKEKIYEGRDSEGNG